MKKVFIGMNLFIFAVIGFLLFQNTESPTGFIILKYGGFSLYIVYVDDLGCFNVRLPNEKFVIVLGEK